MKIITIAGNITRDSELRTTGNGDKVAGFGVAVNDRNRNATFFDVSLWGKRGAALSQYLTKGTSVTVMGELSTHENNGKTYLKVNASELTLQGGGASASSSGGHPNSGPQGYQAPSRDLDTDSIPF